MKIDWCFEEPKLEAWKEGKTGFPFIDAVMKQIKIDGWAHHYARSAVACFLTRGDLWQKWEDGRDYFYQFLLDIDWSITNANWMWLSCSCFDSEYFKEFHPVDFPRKTDPDGLFIRNYVPVLKKYPA